MTPKELGEYIESVTEKLKTAQGDDLISQRVKNLVAAATTILIEAQSRLAR